MILIILGLFYFSVALRGAASDDHGFSDYPKIEASFFCTGFKNAHDSDEITLLEIKRKPFFPEVKCSLFALVGGSTSEHRSRMLTHFKEKFSADPKHMNIGMTMQDDRAFRSATIFLGDSFFKTLAVHEIPLWEHDSIQGQDHISDDVQKEERRRLEDSKTILQDQLEARANLQACGTTSKTKTIRRLLEYSIEQTERSIEALPERVKTKVPIPSLVSLVSVYVGSAAGRPDAIIRASSFQRALLYPQNCRWDSCSYQVHYLSHPISSQIFPICLNGSVSSLGGFIQHLLSKDREVKKALKEKNISKVSERIVRCTQACLPSDQKSCTLFFTFQT